MFYCSWTGCLKFAIDDQQFNKKYCFLENEKQILSLSLSLKTFCIFDFFINTNNLGPLALSQGKTITGRKYLR